VLLTSAHHIVWDGWSKGIYFRELADGQGPIVVHCAAGKDRTGLICALTHHVAGVSRDDMMADYLLTNDESRLARKMDFLGPWIEKQVGLTAPREALRVAVSVNADYLETAFGVIAERHGLSRMTARQAVELVRGQHGHGLTVLVAGEVIVTADVPEIPVGIDGETVMIPTPVRCTIAPRALSVVVPRERPGVPIPRAALEWPRLRQLASFRPQPAIAVSGDGSAPGP